MKISTFLIAFCLFLSCAKLSAQIVINELDADTPSTDTLEFIELKSDNPFQQLDGYILVLFNGSSTSSTGNGRAYYVLDLDGLITDENGLVLIGTEEVSPVPDVVIWANTIQNGSDAAAVYLGEPSDFILETTFATTTNLIDALVYETGDPLNQNLLDLLGEPVQYDEGENGNKDSQSLQRKNDGTYEAKTPTPYSLNDTANPSYVGVGYNRSTTEINEGDAFSIEFTLSESQSTDFTLNFSLDNGTFDTSDYTGSTQVVIEANTTSNTLNFTTINDNLDEGDEILRINIQNDLPQGYKRLVDNERITVIDDDFVVASYGTPLDPTFGTVTSTAPASYYDSLEGLSGTALGEEITNIIADPNTSVIHTYADIIEILKSADRSPLNSNQVWLMYSEQQRSILDLQTTSQSTGKWNREHIYPRSRGGFFSIEYDDVNDGINIFTESRADSLRHGYSDAHHLRATDGPENSSRSNDDYPEYNGPAGSQGSWHGDVARALFYMDYRYNGLELVNGNPSNGTTGQLGDLATLIQWHREDPADDFEMNRNNVIFEWQNNRNPFIDLPDLAEFIYGDNAGQEFTLSTDTIQENKLQLYPNPSDRSFYLRGIDKAVKINIYDTLGRLIQNTEVEPLKEFNHNLKDGTYLIHITDNDLSQTLKLVVTKN